MNKLFIAIVILVVSASALFSMTEAETKEAYVLFNSGSYRDLTRHLDEIKGKDAEYYKLRGLGCLYDTQYKDSAKVSRICREKLLTDYKTDTGIYPFCVLIDLMNGSMSDLTETLDTLSKQKPGGTDDYLLAVYYLLSHLDTIPGVRIEEKDRLTINSRLDNDALFDFAKGRIPYRQDMSGIGIIVSGLNMDDYDEEHWAKLTKSNLTSRDFTLARILVKDVSSFINKILVYERLMDMYADNRLLQNDCKDAIYSYTEEQMSDGAAKNLTQYYQTHIDRVDKLIAKYPDNKVIKTLKADFLYLSGRYEECIELCKSVESNDPDACILIVLSALANGDTSKQETYNAKLGKIYEKTFEDYKRSYRLLYYILACNEKRKGSIDGTFGYYDKC
ncbi:MAG: hypothetical protein J5758_02530, partial [Abditibacteriota bacterium]|nr:hypothetical protein [Abditibacteriota bacterium]